MWSCCPRPGAARTACRCADACLWTQMLRSTCCLPVCLPALVLLLLALLVSCLGLQVRAQDASMSAEERGLQVYGFGPVSITMDTANNVVRANLGDKWMPVSLEQLVQAASQKRRH